jgi:hypothetical protein
VKSRVCHNRASENVHLHAFAWEKRSPHLNSRALLYLTLGSAAHHPQCTVKLKRFGCVVVAVLVEVAVAAGAQRVRLTVQPLGRGDRYADSLSRAELYGNGAESSSPYDPRSRQFGRAFAPIMPQAVHAMRGPNPAKACGRASDRRSAPLRRGRCVGRGSARANRRGHVLLRLVRRAVRRLRESASWSNEGKWSNGTFSGCRLLGVT